MSEALYLHLRHAETPLERLLRESLQIFRARHGWELQQWSERAKAEVHAMAVVRHQGIGQQVRHIRVRLMARFDLIPSPFDPDYQRVIQAVNSRYIAALTDALF